MKPSLLLPILVVALALAGCGGAGSTDGTSAGSATGRTPAPRSPKINALGVSEPEGAARPCPHEGRRIRREIAKLKRLARRGKTHLGTEEITVSCPPQWTPGDRVQASHRQR